MLLDTAEGKEVFRACNRFLTHDYPKNPRQVLAELAEATDPELEADRYGQGELIARFESEVAALLTPFPEIEIVLNPPHTNMMHLYIRGEREKLEAAALAVARETHIWLFYGLAPTLLPGFARFELTVGEATLDLSGQEIVEAFRMMLNPEI